MEQVKRIDGVLYYGLHRCVDIEDAYCRFRDDYNTAIGKAVHLRLDRLGLRKERVHGFGIVRTGSYVPKRCGPVTRVKYRLLGLINLCYWWSVDVSPVSEDEFEDWVDYAFTKGSGALTYVCKTNRRKKKRKPIITLNF